MPILGRKQRLKNHVIVQVESEFSNMALQITSPCYETASYFDNETKQKVAYDRLASS